MKNLLLILTITLATTLSFAATESDVKEKAQKFDMGCPEQSELAVTKIVNKYRYEYEKPTDPEREAVFFIATCQTGAYNESSVLFFDDPYSELQVVPLATPVTNSKLKLLGFTSETVVGGLSYDSKTKTLVSFRKGRGIGDLSETGTYQIFNDIVVLRKFEVDNTPDEKMNPKVVYSAKLPLKH